MVLVIDNYDSFTFNLVQAIAAWGRTDVHVVRNDAVSVEDCRRLRPDGVVLSPGPCTPREAGISVELVRRLGAHVPILGVCLGHQCIAEAFGAPVVRAARLMHGKTSLICHDGRGVYAGLPSPFRATRYHSLIVDEAHLPAELEIASRSEHGELMGLRHRDWPIEGVQFHPESYLTEWGGRLVGNFLRLVERACRGDAEPAGARIMPQEPRTVYGTEPRP